MMRERDFEAAHSVGVSAWQRATSKTLLVVGAGGIGCELLKDLVLAGFGRIHLIDLDSIDVSNLNRQFLFHRQHVNKSKAHIARESALRFNPDAHIVSYHNSIYETQFDVDWFKSFDLVLNALDNIPARKHVNMMCRAADRPLIESGTAGYLGQVSVHLKNTQCFDCEPKPTPKTYPVCTIRSTPSAPIHCIVWSKSWLFNLLFGRDDDQEDATIQATGDDNAQEVAELKKEADELSEIKSRAGSEEFARLVFEKIFTRDVQRLLGMTEMWANRDPPMPLDYQKLLDERKAMGAMAAGVDRNMKVWTLAENFRVFEDSINALSKRLLVDQKREAEASLSFDKDDEDALDFVTAVTNLRAHIYGIELQSRFKVKEMAGNIIPAISTTNAIIAGLMVLQAFNILNGKTDDCKNTYLVHGGARQIICGEKPPGPSRECGTCQAGYFTLTVDISKFTLGEFVDLVLGDKAGEKGLSVEGEISINEAGRLIYDPDFDENAELTFEALKIVNAARLLVLVDNDDDASKSLVINFFVKHEEGQAAFVLDGDRKFPPRPSVKAPEPELEPEPVTGGVKRSAEEDIEEGPAGKKAKVSSDEIVITDDDVIIL
ncbi:hypothetical protein BC830DRAFT_1153578 [Chytriomyces sp. MP71]|nr:hypothetical protein BC830DRAFT_1153578 [Chytriomyces sp. MP71]